jgi:hypothetical protein
MDLFFRTFAGSIRVFEMCKTQFEDAFLGFAIAKLALSILLRMRFLNAKTDCMDVFCNFHIQYLGPHTDFKSHFAHCHDCFA